jgi:hypothetical protein
VRSVSAGGSPGLSRQGARVGDAGSEGSEGEDFAVVGGARVQSKQPTCNAVKVPVCTFNAQAKVIVACVRSH